MPTYEYRCPSCTHEFETVQSFWAEAKADCPECGAAANRLISMPAIHFKGSGFYKTDYASNGSRGANGTKTGKSDGSESSSTPSSSESSGDAGKSKTAAKSSESSTSKASAPAGAASSTT